ncbi:MAG: hypothetical protein M5T61_09230 [Acidimicrobiia bacterium]|nr:hypothetical protein [Acidimicrobiia bacterium]
MPAATCHPTEFADEQLARGARRERVFDVAAETLAYISTGVRAVRGRSSGPAKLGNLRAKGARRGRPRRRPRPHPGDPRRADHEAGRRRRPPVLERFGRAYPAAMACLADDLC